MISIVVPAYNEERLLGGTLNAIRNAARAFEERGWGHELIVCNNNSTDRTAEVAARSGAAVVFEPINQIGRARNRGAQAARGAWLLFVDADSHPTAGLFGDVVRAIESNRCIAGGATLQMTTSRGLARLTVGFWNLISRMFRFVAGAFIFCEAGVFRELGGFDESLYASEEIDLSKRLKRLARQRGTQVVILQAHPVLTSDRKVHLYSWREHLRVILKALVTGTRSLRHREHCATWYDGRR